MPSPLLLRNVVKRFGRTIAVNGLSLEIASGEIYGLIGPNGAGKTTTLRMVVTLLKPTSGKIEVFGRDVVSEAETVRSMVAYLPEEASAYRRLKGIEYLRLMAHVYAESKREADEMVERGAQLSGLGDRLYDRIETYSKGMQRRLLVARALMVSPKLAVLDEPTSGVDIVHARHVRQVIKREASAGITVLLSSHNMLEVEFVCDRVGILHRGRLIAEGTPDELKAAYGASNLEEVFEEAVKVAARS